MAKTITSFAIQQLIFAKEKKKEKEKIPITRRCRLANSWQSKAT